jgi:hypothetical protein
VHQIPEPRELQNDKQNGSDEKNKDEQDDRSGLQHTGLLKHCGELSPNQSWKTGNRQARLRNSQGVCGALAEIAAGYCLDWC